MEQRPLYFTFVWRGAFILCMALLVLAFVYTAYTVLALLSEGVSV